MYEDIEAENDELRKMTIDDLLREAKVLHIRVTARTIQELILTVLDAKFGPSAVNRWMAERIGNVIH